MSNRPRPSQPPERRQLTRRQIDAQQREANVQRRVVLALGGAVGLALLLVIGGFVYDRLVIPSRTLKQVNNATLTRGEYERLTRVQTIQQMARTLQFSKLFGSNQSFGQGGRFDEQIVQANLQLLEIGTARSRQEPVADTLVDQWVDQQITEQQAQEQFQINPEGGEVDQLLVSELGSVLPATSPTTDTAGVTETVTAEASEAATAEASVASTAATSPTATAVPTATPLPAEATNQANQIVDELYTEYVNILGALPEEAAERQRTPHATKEEMAEALRALYRQQLIQQRVGEALVKEVPADDASEPDRVSARHILLQVPKPSPTPEAAAPDATETATAEETATPEAIPTPTPTPSPEELETLFAERKAEADEIYQQLIAKPETFADVARELSEDQGSASQGGDVGSFDRQGQTDSGQTLVQPFVDAAWALKENEISQPVRTDFGWHIIQRVPEDPEVKLRRLREAAYEKWLAEQRQAATIVPAPTPAPTEVPVEPVESAPASSAEPSSTTTP